MVFDSSVANDPKATLSSWFDKCALLGFLQYDQPK